VTGFCNQCGQCCQRTPGITLEDANRIAIGLGITLRAVKDKYLERERGIWFLKRTGHFGICVFLKPIIDGNLITGRVKQAECTIHKFKPTVCQIKLCGMEPDKKEKLIADCRKTLNFKW